MLLLTFIPRTPISSFFFFNDPAPPEFYPLPLHDALPFCGVACTRTLVELAARRLAGNARVGVASPRLNTDNAAMIARAGWHRLALGERSDWTLDARADLPQIGRAHG